MRHWGRRLAELRTARGFTQIALSVACKWSGNGTVARLEGRADAPSNRTIARLALAMGYSEAEIRGDVEPVQTDESSRVHHNATELPESVPETTGTSAVARNGLQPPSSVVSQEVRVPDDPLFAAVQKLWLSATPVQRRRVVHLLSSDTEGATPARRGGLQARGTPRTRASGS